MSLPKQSLIKLSHGQHQQRPRKLLVIFMDFISCDLRTSQLTETALVHNAPCQDSFFATLVGKDHIIRLHELHPRPRLHKQKLLWPGHDCPHISKRAHFSECWQRKLKRPVLIPSCNAYVEKYNLYKILKLVS